MLEKVQQKEETKQVMCSEQIKQNTIENNFKDENYMICWGFVSLARF